MRIENCFSTPNYIQAFYIKGSITQLFKLENLLVTYSRKVNNKIIYFDFSDFNTDIINEEDIKNLFKNICFSPNLNNTNFYINEYSLKELLDDDNDEEICTSSFDSTPSPSLIPLSNNFCECSEYCIIKQDLTCSVSEQSCEDILYPGMCETRGAAVNENDEIVECVWIEDETVGPKCQSLKDSCENIIYEETCTFLETEISERKGFPWGCFWLLENTTETTSNENIDARCENMVYIFSFIYTYLFFFFFFFKSGTSNAKIL
jgi:hypothetical protein